MRLRSPAPAVLLSSLPLLCLALGATARAAETPPGASVPAPASEAAPADAAPADATPIRTDPNEEVLRRVLRSGCRDGLPDVRALAASGSATWAETVGRLCGEILANQPAPLPPLVATAPSSRPERDGRGAIVIASTVYGIWVGIAADVIFTVDGVRSAIVPPLLGMAAGLGLSLVITGDHAIDNGQAWTIITGLEYGSVNGALWAGGLNLSAQSVVGTALATGLASGAIGLLVADKFDPRQGEIEVVRSGLLWGTATGMLGMLTVSNNGSSETFLRGAGVSMDLGFLAGLALAASFDVSRNRDLIIDAGTLGGGVAGLGVTWLIINGPGSSGRTLAGGTLAGMFAGMVATIYLTRNMDSHDDEAGPTVSALLGRDARGRWRWGTPGPTPVLDGLGRRIIGATFNALGGTF
jgi:hypothetical protein